MPLGKTEVVVITGASAGVGRATVRRFAKDRARIALIARGQEGLNAAYREAISMGGEAMIIPCDVSNYEEVDKAASQVEEQLGPIDIWINDAMTTVFSEFTNVSADEFKRVNDVTYLGYVYGTKAALVRMIPRNSGTIVQVGSALAYRSIPLQSAYCGAKHAIRGFTDSVRSELLHNKSRIRITMVQLPAVNTPQFTWCKNNMPRKGQPVPPIYQPEVIADGVHWAAHHHRREFVIGSNTWVIIWGNKLLPGLGDWYLAKTGFDAQQYNGPDDPGKPVNLWKPVDKDFGANGEFSGKASKFSLFTQFGKLPGYPSYPLIAVGVILLLIVKLTAWNNKCHCRK